MSMFNSNLFKDSKQRIKDHVKKCMAELDKQAIQATASIDRWLETMRSSLEKHATEQKNCIKKSLNDGKTNVERLQNTFLGTLDKLSNENNTKEAEKLLEQCVKLKSRIGEIVYNKKKTEFVTFSPLNDSNTIVSTENKSSLESFNEKTGDEHNK